MVGSLEIIMLSNLLRGMWLIFGHLTYCTDARMLLQCNGYRYWSWFSNRNIIVGTSEPTPEIYGYSYYSGSSFCVHGVCFVVSFDPGERG